MKQRLLELYRKSPVGRTLMAVPRGIYKSAINALLSDEAWCRTMFKWTHGYGLDLRDPKTLNEKIQWLKLYNRKPEFTVYADKFAVRDYIKERVGERCLIPLLAVSDDPEAIDFEHLARPFIIKPTHSSGKTIIVRDGDSIDRRAIVTKCRGWLETNLYRDGREWHYRDIPPRIVVEQLLLDDAGNIPLDYKFHCIEGRTAAIQVDLDRETNHKRNFYDCHWNLLPFTWSVCVGDRPLWPQGRAVAKPAVLAEMIELSEKLAQAFAYIRIDWYLVGSRIYFGELTFHHGGGYERILPLEWDRTLGDLLHLPVRSGG